MRKFNIGDTVRLNNRCPQWIRKKLQKRTRKIVALRYIPKLKAVHYSLGINNRGFLDLGLVNRFRSYELVKVNGTQKIGRPRMKRKYTRRS